MSLEVTPITAALPVHSDNERLRSAFEAALAPSTWRAYGSAWNAWRRWAADHNLDETPATPATAARYLAHRANSVNR